MRREVISTCPVCEHELSVTRLHCTECGTTLDGSFSVGAFARLSREQLALLKSFLRSRGNLREMERELGLSYPTVRARIDALVRAVGLTPADTGADPDAAAPEPASAPVHPNANAADARTAWRPSRRQILERLARHEITAEQAAEALRGTGEGQ